MITGEFSSSSSTFMLVGYVKFLIIRVTGSCVASWLLRWWWCGCVCGCRGDPGDGASASTGGQTGGAEGGSRAASQTGRMDQ